MTDFITVADVDTLLGPSWAGAGDAVLAVTMANAWLTAKIRKPVADPTPEAIKLAGAQVAKEAAAGLLYKAAEREVLETEDRVEGAVTRKRVFAEGQVLLTAGESFALALLAPWTRRAGVMMLKRV
ncbi:hypothetical protein [Pelagibacterium sp.]|uniref:hypothetical protein n=1 Tax=Pelagibacterium sp. TaxID=1967288 RepID=UPI003A951079